MFAPSNSQQSARYGVNPFQRYEIIIGGASGACPDRSGGVLIPEPQGTGIYIERSDYPVLIGLVNATVNVGQALVARDGLQIEADFKGIYLTHPILLTASSHPIVLSFITFASNDAVLVNQLDHPVSRVGMMNRVVTATATVLSQSIFVPPGVRMLRGLQAVFAATTFSVAQATPTGLNSGSLAVVSSVQQNLGGATGLVTYSNAATWGACGSLASPAVGANTVINFPDIVLPASALEVAVTIVGTVLGGPMQLFGFFQ